MDTEASIIIGGIGTYKPAKVLSNEDLAQIVDTSDEWIVARTGISTRHIASKLESTAYMAVEASNEAIKSAQIPRKAIDLLIVATMTPDMPFPATACLVQHQLGLRPIPAFDVQAACSGFLYALDVAASMLKHGEYNNALVIGSEKLSSIVDWQDRSTCVLFGDGAGAVVLKKENKGNQGGYLGSIMKADGENAKLLYQPAGGSALPASLETIKAKQHFIKMNGRGVFKVAVRLIEEAALEILEKHNLTTDAISLVIPHQANIRIIEALSSRLNISMDRFLINLNAVGNTSAASIPLALDDAFKQNKVKRGDLILMVAFGAGLTWVASLVKWYLC